MVPLRHGVGRAVVGGDDAVVGPLAQLFHQSFGKGLPDAIGLRAVLNSGNVNRVQVGRQAGRVIAGGVIAAGGRQAQQRHRSNYRRIPPEFRPCHWTFPRGLRSDHALRALHGRQRRNAQVVGRRPQPEATRSLRILAHENLDLLLSGRIHIAGRLFPALQHVDVLAGNGSHHLGGLRGRVQFNVKRKRVSVEDGCLQQHQRRYAQLVLHNAAEMPHNAALHRCQRRYRLVAVAVQQIEGNLRIEDSLRQLLEGQQVHRLLVQLVHAAPAMLGSRLEQRGNGAHDVADFLRAQQQQGQYDGRRMGGDDRRFGEVDLVCRPQFVLHPGRAQQRVRTIFQSVRQVDDVAARPARHLPAVAREAFIGGEEGEVHVVQVFRKNALDERGLFADSLQLAERLFVVEQANVGARENCDRSALLSVRGPSRWRLR